MFQQVSAPVFHQDCVNCQGWSYLNELDLDLHPQDSSPDTGEGGKVVGMKFNKTGEHMLL